MPHLIMMTPSKYYKYIQHTLRNRRLGTKHKYDQNEQTWVEGVDTLMEWEWQDNQGWVISIQTLAIQVVLDWL